MQKEFPFHRISLFIILCIGPWRALKYIADNGKERWKYEKSFRIQPVRTDGKNQHITMFVNG